MAPPEKPTPSSRLLDAMMSYSTRMAMNMAKMLAAVELVEVGLEDKAVEQILSAIQTTESAHDDWIKAVESYCAGKPDNPKVH